MSQNKVLIIGAGLGGLVLAQILHENGVPFEIFERDEKTSHRGQGWAIALIESLPQLERLLPASLAKNLYQNSVNINTGDHDELAFVDAESGKKVASVGGVPRGEDGHILRASRSGFRNFLLQAQDLPVSMGKQFTHYTESPDSVTAHFKDGSTATGALLIGADGVHSHVLDQLIGASSHVPVLSKYVPIFGEVNLPPRLYEPIRKLGNAVVLAGARDVRMQIGMLHMSADLQTAAYFWGLVVKRESPTEMSDWVQTATKQELYDFVLAATEGHDATLTDLIRYGGPNAITDSQPKFLEYVPPENMPDGRVTVLGDAAHAMIPFKGAGANTAILDACDIGVLLCEAHKQGKDFSSVVSAYHEIMIPRGRENVLSSRAAGEVDGNPTKAWSVMFKRPGQAH